MLMRDPERGGDELREILCNRIKLQSLVSGRFLSTQVRHESPLHERFWRLSSHHELTRFDKVTETVRVPYDRKVQGPCYSPRPMRRRSVSSHQHSKAAHVNESSRSSRRTRAGACRSARVRSIWRQLA